MPRCRAAGPPSGPYRRRRVAGAGRTAQRKRSRTSLPVTRFVALFSVVLLCCLAFLEPCSVYLTGSGGGRSNTTRVSSPVRFGLVGPHLSVLRVLIPAHAGLSLTNRIHPNHTTNIHVHIQVTPTWSDARSATQRKNLEFPRRQKPSLVSRQHEWPTSIGPQGPVLWDAKIAVSSFRAGSADANRAIPGIMGRTPPRAGHKKNFPPIVQTAGHLSHFSIESVRKGE